MFSTILHVVQVLSALALIGIILIQQGKGASMGAAFGSGASATNGPCTPSTTAA
jgi:preprotein translocase subunit SecG